MGRQNVAAPEPVGTVELRLELPGDLLRLMAQQGPAAVVQWALQQNIFRIENATSATSAIDSTAMVQPRLCYGDLVRRVLSSLADSPDGGQEPRVLTVQRPEAGVAEEVAAFVEAMEGGALQGHREDSSVTERTLADGGCSVSGRISTHTARGVVDSRTESKRSDGAVMSTGSVYGAIALLDRFSNMWGRLYPFGSDVYTVETGWEAPGYVACREDGGAGLVSAGSSRQCVHNRLCRGVATCSLCRRCRAVNVLNELPYSTGPMRYCSKIKFESELGGAREVSSSSALPQLRVTIHALKPIELYEKKPSVVRHVDNNGNERHFLEEKCILILAEGAIAAQPGSADALDFKVNNSLLRVSFYDRGLRMASKPPVQVYTDCVDIVEDTETDLEEWCISGLQQRGRRSTRPQTARVMHMLLVEEEVAEIVPYDEMATTIQVATLTDLHRITLLLSCYKLEFAACSACKDAGGRGGGFRGSGSL